jgi:steroid delta-isomerase-like uncharacterized protein
MGADADIIRRLTDEAFVGGNASVIDDLVGDDYVDHDPPPGLSADKAGFRQVAELVATAFSDRKMEFDDYLETSDGKIVESWAMTGTHTAEAFGVPPSNQSIRVRGMEIWRCSGGKVVEHWGVVDMSDVFEKAAAS